jgi:hypothetical protein
VIKNGRLAEKKIPRDSEDKKRAGEPALFGSKNID